VPAVETPVVEPADADAAPADAAPVPAPAPGAAAQAMAPTPYTAAQIREASPKGRTLEFCVVEKGKAVRVRRMVFVEVSEREATVESTWLDYDHARDEVGKVLEAPSRSTAAWEGLRKHAEFPAAATQVSEAETTVPAGTFACRVYEVKGEGGAVQRFHFARELPGPPVLLETFEDGVIVFSMALSRHVVP
jgi:hypothetical protein